MFPESPSWQCPPTPLESLCLETGEVHLWRISLDLESERLEQLAAHLDTQEERRARRFLQRRHRQRFRAGRGALREIVAAYLGAEAGDLRFDYGPQGKPHLGGDPPPLSFNLAHSHGVALCAVCREGEIGVDIERLRPIERAQGIAESYFSSRESRFLAALEGAGERLQVAARIPQVVPIGFPHAERRDTGADAQPSAFPHRIARVDREIHQHLLELGRVGGHQRTAVFDLEREVDVTRNQRRQQALGIAHELATFEGPW